MQYLTPLVQPLGHTRPVFSIGDVRWHVSPGAGVASSIPVVVALADDNRLTLNWHDVCERSENLSAVAVPLASKSIVSWLKQALRP
jgi:hypothetical protein